MSKRTKHILGGILVNLAAFGIFIWGGGWHNLEKVLAATQSYSETWTVTNYRALVYDFTGWGGGYSPVVTLGPAQWSVYGQNNSTGASWSETWQASGWSDAGSSLCGNWYYCTYNYSGSLVSVNGSFANTGEYGWTYFLDTSNWQGYRAQFYAGASWPTGWTVNGTINTP